MHLSLAQRPFDFFFFLVLCNGREPREPSHTDDFFDLNRKGGVEPRVLGYVADRFNPAARRCAEYQNFAARRLEKPHNQLEERTFACPVLACQRDKFSSMNMERDIVEYFDVLEAEREVLAPNCYIFRQVGEMFLGGID